MHKPMVQAMVLADVVYRDAETGKHIIAGTFSKLGVFEKEENLEHRTFPDSEIKPDDVSYAREVRQCGSPYLYFAVTDLPAGQSNKFVTRFVNLADHSTIFEAHFQIATTEDFDRLDVFEFALPLPSMNGIELIRRLSRLGMTIGEDRGKGSHVYATNPNGGGPTIIPKHSKDLYVGLFRDILKQLNVSEDQIRNA